MKHRIVLVLLMSIIMLKPCFSQFEQASFNVAIFVHEGVELFDFAGPGEVFVAAGFQSPVIDFNVYTVAKSEEELTSQTFLKIVPNYSIHNCPPPDVIVLPGGATNTPLNNPDVMEWVKSAYEDSQVTLSVCTGAFLLAKAGLLDGLKATTHWGAIDGLRNGYPNVSVLEETKFIDNGKIITSGGVSSGVEGSLHLVSRIAGRETSEKVAHYMEYGNWDSRVGLVEKECDFIIAVKENGFEHTLANQNSANVFYGELLNLADDYIEKGDIEKAIPILEYLTKEYPTAASFDYLGNAYKRAGKDTPPSRADISALVDKGELETAIGLLEKAQTDFPNWIVIDESDINGAGYQLMRAGKLADAIAVFGLNVKLNPKSFNAWDSLAEAHFKNGDKELAIKYYKKSLELNPDNKNGKEMLEKIKSEG